MWVEVELKCVGREWVWWGGRGTEEGSLKSFLGLENETTTKVFIFSCRFVGTGTDKANLSPVKYTKISVHLETSKLSEAPPGLLARPSR